MERKIKFTNYHNTSDKNVQSEREREKEREKVKWAGPHTPLN